MQCHDGSSNLGKKNMACHNISSITSFFTGSNLALSSTSCTISYTNSQAIRHLQDSLLHCCKSKKPPIAFSIQNPELCT